MDARLVAAQLDQLVIQRLSAQTAHGGQAAGTTKTAAGGAKTESSKAETASANAAAEPTEEELQENENARIKALAEAEGISKRQALREAKMAKIKAKRDAKKDKQARLRRRAETKGEPVP